MLEIYAKSTPALLYTLETIFSDWLSLKWQIIDSEVNDVIIKVRNHPGEIAFPNILFSRLTNLGLCNALFPPSPIPRIGRFNFLEIDEIGLNLPVIFCEYSDLNLPDASLEDAMKIDIFGSVFFMLSRLEEVIINETDVHDRFISSASLAVKEGFIDRPIVDEYVEVLWGVLSNKWLFLKRTYSKGKVVATCDVDRPLEYPINHLVIFKQFLKDLIKKDTRSVAFDNVWRRSYLLLGNYTKDKNLNNIRWMMSENEKHNRSVEFNFVAGVTDKSKDPFYKLSDKSIGSILLEIDKRGHKIGIHPSYHTYLSKENMRHEVSHLRKTLLSLNIDQKVQFGRQHFLRWKTSSTIHNWINSGLKFDSSMGFADIPGFRSGTAKQFKWFDVIKNESTILIERPLIFMECSVLSKRYLNLDYSDETLTYILDLKRKSLKYGGDFVFLWHDYYFYSEKDYEFYSKIVS
jgi:hypothetical protein